MFPSNLLPKILKSKNTICDFDELQIFLVIGENNLSLAIFV